MKTFTIAYRTGGTKNFSWHRTLAFATKAEAEQGAEEVRRGGRPALVFDTGQLDSIGLPEGF